MNSSQASSEGRTQQLDISCYILSFVFFILA